MLRRNTENRIQIEQDRDNGAKEREGLDKSAGNGESDTMFMITSQKQQKREIESCEVIKAITFFS